MAQLDELITPLAMRVAKVPNFVAIAALRFAAQEFAQQSLLWQVQQEIAVDGTARGYPLTVPAGCLVAAIVAASLDGKPLRQGFDYELDDTNFNVLSAFTGTVQVLVALKTGRTSELVGDELLDHYTPALVSGAAAFLGAQENQPWSLSKGQMQLFQATFESGYQEARKRALNKANRLYEGQTKHQFF